MWDIPVPMKRLVLAPAERADVLVDFSSFPGARLVMKNHKPPKPVSNPAPQLEQGNAVPCRENGHAALVPVRSTSSLPGGVRASLTDPLATRYITLNEVEPEEVEWFLNMNAVHFG